MTLNSKGERERESSVPYFIEVCVRACYVKELAAEGRKFLTSVRSMNELIKMTKTGKIFC